VTSALATATRRPGLVTRPVAVSIPMARVTGRVQLTVMSIDV